MKDHCRRHFERLSEFIDGELDLMTSDEIKAHLESCPECAACLATFRKTVDLYKNLDPETLPPRFITELKKFIRSKGADRPLNR